MTNTTTVTYLGRCRRCRAGHRVDLPAVELVRRYPDDALEEADRLQAAGEFDGFAARMAWLAERAEWVEVRTDRHRSTTVRCECGAVVGVSLLVARTSEHVCGSKCLTALGPSCECRCGGENHGRMYLPGEQAS